MPLQALSPEEYKEYVKVNKSFQTLHYDTVIVKRKKKDGLDSPEVEEAYLVSDIIEALRKK